MAITRLALFLIVALTLVSPAAAQVQRWNGPRALEMIGEARTVRQGMAQDSTLQSYSSQARGYVYFYLDRGDTGERVLVKTDQIALEVYWAAPDKFKQRIVGLRDEKKLPTNIHYHLDHLVVVQDEFGDRIRIGDGDEVEAVVHPAAAGSEGVYDFLLSDSVTLDLPATDESVRVYEIQVRPKNFEVPGFVGSVFLDRDTKAIVRMSFTFTPASYVDSYLHHISISLENSLWEGRYWLPYRQQLELRREVPYLDIPAGSVIRGSFEVREYEINPELPPSLFLGSTISALPEATRKAFPFEEDLYAQLEEEGLEGFQSPPEMEEIQALALSIAKDHYLSGLRGTRLFLPSPTISSAIRHNRTEGLFLGGGFSHSPAPSLGLALYGGFSFGREKPTLEMRVTGGERSPTSQLHLYQNRPRDLGPVPAISGVLNSLASLTLSQDYTDLFFATGASVTHTFALSTEIELRMTARLERQRRGKDVVSSDVEDTDYRPVISLDRGSWASLEATGSFPTPMPGLSLSLEGTMGRFDDGFGNSIPVGASSAGMGESTSDNFGSLAAGFTYEKGWLTRGTALWADLRGGTLLGEPPMQGYFFLGGRQTLPGHAFRSQVGDRFWLARTEGSMDLLHPILRLRAFGAAGRAWGKEMFQFPSGTGSGDTPVLFSAGLGLGLGWDVLRLDFARGLGDGGEWQVILAVRSDFWPFL
ncbi:MAG: hypothetical protein HKO65_04025 [Gemmatimonadetes bacterium]|nr:hypothetical protein [Gemmatimonadota bacterium]